jgi:Thermolysin metallopeptidase, alpha-helical domain
LSGWFYRLANRQDMGAGQNAQFDNAFTIAIRATDLYLSGSSNYQDMRNATIRAAQTYFGGCSQQERAVVAEWNTAGVFDANYGPCFRDCAANPPTVVSISSPANCGQPVTITAGSAQTIVGTGQEHAELIQLPAQVRGVLLLQVVSGNQRSTRKVLIE